MALIDTEVDVAYENSGNTIWVNRGEVPGNGIDDDGNLHGRCGCPFIFCQFSANPLPGKANIDSIRITTDCLGKVGGTQGKCWMLGRR